MSKMVWRCRVCNAVKDVTKSEEAQLARGATPPYPPKCHGEPMRGSAQATRTTMAD